MRPVRQTRPVGRRAVTLRPSGTPTHWSTASRIAARRRLRPAALPAVVPDADLPTIARALARELAAGLPVGPALRRAAAAVDDSGAAALHRAAHRIEAGEEPDAALAELGSGAAARLLTAAVAINVELGGDLVEALEALAEGLADRDRLRGELEVATTQSRMTARIVPAVPAVSLAMLALTDMSSLRALVTSGPGLAILSLSLSLTVLGVLAVNRVLAGALR